MDEKTVERVICEGASADFLRDARHALEKLIKSETDVAVRHVWLEAKRWRERTYRERKWTTLFPVEVLSERRSEPESQEVGTPVGELARERDLLQTQLIAERRALLSSRRSEEYFQAQNERQLEYIGELAKANRALQAVLIAHDVGHVCMHEKRSGVVTDAQGNEVAVVYETADGPVEQVYGREQFMHGRLPEQGDGIEAHILLARTPRDVVAARSEEDERGRDKDEFRAFREKGVSGPIEI